MKISRARRISLSRSLFANMIAFAAMLFALALAPAAHAAMSFPALTGRVVDDANVLSEDTKSRLTQLLAQEEKQTKNQLVVVTLQSLGGYPVEDYGYQLGRHWGIGLRGKNTGALIIVVPSDHKVRIEVGYGLEGVLTDAASKVVIDRYMLPAFKRGDFNGGVLAGTNAVIQLLGGVTLTPSQYSDDDQSQQGRQSRHGLPWGFIVLILVWVVFGRFLWPLLFLGGLGGMGRSGGWSGGGFGGGGFSGGGGSFGGGGASGSW